MRATIRPANEPSVKMQIPVLYRLFVAEPGSWASAPLGRLENGRVCFDLQVPKRGSPREAPPTASERAETSEPLQAAA